MLLNSVGSRLSRWTMYLQQFNFEVQYWAGKEHTNADVLSRLPPDDVIMPVMELGGTRVDVQAAQKADEQLFLIVTALSSNSPLPCKIALALNNVIWMMEFFATNFKDFPILAIPSLSYPVACII